MAQSHSGPKALLTHATLLDYSLGASAFLCYQSETGRHGSRKACVLAESSAWRRWTVSRGPGAQPPSSVCPTPTSWSLCTQVWGKDPLDVNFAFEGAVSIFERQDCRVVNKAHRFVSVRGESLSAPHPSYETLGTSVNFSMSLISSAKWDNNSTYLIGLL